jgi:hypothetical protein
MVYRRSAIAIVALGVLCLAGCRGSADTQPIPSVRAALVRSPDAGAGTVSVSLPVIVVPNTIPTPPPGESSIDALSSATRSISGSFGAERLKAVTLTAARKGCRSESDGLHCRITLKMRPGSHVLTLTTYASLDGTGAPLAQATTYHTVTIATGPNPVRLGYFFGIAKAFTTTISPAAVTQGVPNVVTFSLYGLDAAGAVIPESSVYDENGIVVTSHIGVKSGPYTAQGIYRSYGNAILSEVFPYDGRMSGTEVFEFFGSGKNAGVKYASATLTMNPGPAGVPQIAVWNWGAHAYMPGTLVLFTADANGNASPWRTYSLEAPAISMDDSGGFWAGPFTTDERTTGATWMERYDNTGKATANVVPSSPGLSFVGAAIGANQDLYAVQGTLRDSVTQGHECPAKEPSLATYTAASSWTRVPRSINLRGVQCPASVAVDRQGNTYVTRPYGIVDEFAPNVNGDAPPIREFTGGAYSMATDSAGNFYEVGSYYNENGSCIRCLREFAPGSSTPVYILPTVYPVSIAIDAHDVLYVLVQQSELSATYFVEVFPPGATTPSRTITGPNTGLTQPQFITVAP